MSQPADHPSGRRVALPHGSAVDMTAVQGDALAERALHVCPDCRSLLVAPVAWEQAGPAQWAITLECPNCAWWDADIFDEQLVERFDEELDRGTEALVRDLMRLMRANMEDDVERFVLALRADAILPEDFQPRRSRGQA